MRNNSGKTNNTQGLPEFTVKFANTVFLLGLFLSVLFTVFSMYKMYNPHLLPISQKFYIICILFGGISFILFGVGLRMGNLLKVILATFLVITGITAFAYETYLEFSKPVPITKKEIAEKMGITYDTRTKMEVFEDLIASGIEAYPNIYPSLFRASNGLNTDKGKIFPLGTISSITTILGNESAHYWTIETDEHGFNNPKGLYKKNSLDILLTGDSQAEGYSVNSDQTISASLRELGFNTISVGKAANGPLQELATLKEYAEPLQPKIVLWIYYGNDIPDLKSEIVVPFLMRYLNEEGFTQHLISRQDEIDKAVENYFQKKKMDHSFSNKSNLINYIQEIYEPSEVEKIASSLIGVLKLTNLRSQANLKPAPKTQGPSIFKNILEEAKKKSLWVGGGIIFCLPASNSSLLTSLVS